MAIFFDKDPLTGITQYYDYDPTKDEHLIHSVQDPTALVEQLKQARNNPDAWAKGMKESWVHYASIPPIIEMQLKLKALIFTIKTKQKNYSKK